MILCDILIENISIFGIAGCTSVLCTIYAVSNFSLKSNALEWITITA